MKSSLIFYRERNRVLVSDGREKVPFGELWKRRNFPENDMLRASREMRVLGDA